MKKGKQEEIGHVNQYRRDSSECIRPVEKPPPGCKHISISRPPGSSQLRAVRFIYPDGERGCSYQSGRR